MKAFIGLCRVTFIFALFGGSCASGDDLRLVPYPKSVAVQPGEFRFTSRCVLEIPSAQVQAAELILLPELKRAGLPLVEIRSSNSDRPVFRLRRARSASAESPKVPNQGREAYALTVTAREGICAANEAPGLIHGLQTLCQLIRANRHGSAVPCLRIEDWPALAWRCFQDDMTRGPSSKLETLKSEAAMGSYLKFNLMTWYMEYQYAFKKHPVIGPVNGSLTPEEVAALVSFARPLNVDILGNQQSFGHFAHILKHPQYAALRETPDVLTPVKEETYQLLDDMYSEICPVVPFPWFNVCCDETWGLGTGPSKELAQQIGVGGVYVRHIRRVHDLLESRHNKRMMMWGDIILQHPKELPLVPTNTIMLTWGYDARPTFEDQIIPFARSGYEFFVCPGVNNWSRILPDFGVAITNIHNFVRDGCKHGALGMLNTDWEDDGEAINAVKWHADAWAAECAWNASAIPLDDFQKRVGAVLFGESGHHFADAVALLAKTHRLPGMDGMFNARFWKADFAPASNTAPVRAAATNLLQIVQPALVHLQVCRREASANQPVLDAYLFGARRMERIALRMLDGLEVADLYGRAWTNYAAQSTSGNDRVVSFLRRAEALIKSNREAHAELGRQFAELWLSESKPYALDWTTRRYEDCLKRFDDLLERVVKAREACMAGQPMPTPGDLGLAPAR